MPKLRSGEEWAKSLRQDIKTEIGLGWNVCGHKRTDGTGNGTHAGAKSWAEDPSMVISLDRALDHDGRQVGVTAQFKKDRAATVDPHRKLTFSLNRENGGFLLSPEVELVGTCSEAIIDVLYKAHQNGRDRLRRK